MGRKPPKEKRPKIRTVRTTKTGDPNVNKIYFAYDVDQVLPVNSFKEEVLSKIKNIKLTLSNNINNDYQGTSTLTLNNVNYEIVEDPSGNVSYSQFYCSIQPTPNHAVDNYFNTANDKEMNITITYYGEEDGSHIEFEDKFFNKKYFYPTEHQQ